MSPFLAIILAAVASSSLAEPSYYAPYSYGYHQTLLQSSPYLYSSPLVPKLITPIASPYVDVIPKTVIPAAFTTVVEGVKTQYHTQDIHGQASYGHSEPEQTHTAVQDVHGNKVGSFSYVRPDGHVHKTDYVADAAGYRVASNDLPVGPVATAPAIVPLVHSLHKRSIYGHAVPVVTPSGHLADTPEVAAAKAAHFAEHAKHGNYYGAPTTSWHGSYAAHAPSWHGSYAAPVVTPDGYIADTPDVAAAKAAHFAEHAKRGSYHGSSWHGAAVHGAAPVVVTADGYVADAPDVAAAKVAHFAEHAKRGNYYAASHVPSWQHAGSYATPVVTPSGYLADTPEVAAAKAAHFAEKAKASASHYNDIPYTSYAPYAPAAPVVLTPSGHVADTPEVAHAKAAHLAEYAAIASRHKRSILSLLQTPASTVPLHRPVLYPYAAPIAHPLAYSHYPVVKPLTHTTIVHGPHAVSYTVQ